METPEDGMEIEHPITARDGQSDDAIMAEFGYKPELKRILGAFTNFAIVFSFIGVSVGVFLIYSSILGTAGPRGIFFWPIVCAGQMLVCLVLAALAGRIPISGLSYQWMSRMTHPIAGWFLGWAFIGYVVISNAAILVGFFDAFGQIVHVTFSSRALTFLGIGMLLLEGALVSLSTRATTSVNNTAVWAELAAGVIFGIGLVILGLLSPHAGAGAHTVTSAHPASAVGYWAFFGPFTSLVVLGAYVFSGFDTAASVYDETVNPYRVGPRQMIRASLIAALLGCVYLFGITVASSGDFKVLAAAPSPVADVLQERFGTAFGDIAIAAVLIAFLSVSLLQVVVGGRLVWAISRDNLFPFSRFFHKVAVKRDAPDHAIWLVVALMIVVMSLFTRLTVLIGAISTIPVLVYGAVCVAYVFRRKHYPVQPGGFSLGRFDLPVAIAAVLWTVLILILIAEPAVDHKGLLIDLVVFAAGAIWIVILAIRDPVRLRRGKVLETDSDR
jgi:amino acid transporter